MDYLHYLSPASWAGWCRAALRRRQAAVALWWRRLSWWRKGLAILGGTAASILLLIFLILAGGVAYYSHKAGQFDLKRIVHMPERSVILDRNGVELGFLQGHGDNRVIVKKADVADAFIKALLTREDSRFYWHGGIDWISVIRAAQVNWKAESIEQGASTLTMQLARNALDLDRDRTYGRKLLEAALASRIEGRFSKDEILELYMNRIYFGSGLYGIERAAQGYFKKPARDLSLAESALLAGLIRAPSSLSPFRNPEAAVRERDVVLDRMAEDRRISRADAAAAKLEALHLRPENERVAELDYVKDAVHRELDLILDPKRIEAGGLTVRVTIDRALQDEAEAILRKRLREVEALPGYAHPRYNPRARENDPDQAKILQGAIVAIDNETGGTLALVGGRDYGQSSFNRAWDAKRQVGSTFKPFVYATAFSHGILPGAWEDDSPISLPGGNGRSWSPQNSDGGSLGTQPVKVGLIRSRNTMSVRLGLRIGVDTVRQTASAAGLGDQLPDSPVALLGAFEADPRSLTAAYTVFPNQGIRKRTFLISRIETRDGEVVFQNLPVQLRVLPPGAAWLTSQVLGEVLGAEGTAASARTTLGLDFPAYGKTGTTDDYRDAWFAGFTGKVTCGVWVGFDQPATIVSRGYGSKLALPVWVDVMKFANDHGYPAAELTPPGVLQTTSVCRICSGLASRWTGQSYTIELPADCVPTTVCRGHLLAARPQKDRSQGFFGRLFRRFR